MRLPLIAEADATPFEKEHVHRILPAVVGPEAQSRVAADLVRGVEVFGKTHD